MPLYQYLPLFGSALVLGPLSVVRSPGCVLSFYGMGVSGPRRGLCVVSCCLFILCAAEGANHSAALTWLEGPARLRAFSFAVQVTPPSITISPGGVKKVDTIPGRLRWAARLPARDTDTLQRPRRS